MKKGLISIVICALFIIFVHFHISIVISKPGYAQYKQPKPIVPRYKNPNQIWISMGLCYDQTTNLYNKKKSWKLNIFEELKNRADPRNHSFQGRKPVRYDTPAYPHSK